MVAPMLRHEHRVDRPCVRRWVNRCRCNSQGSLVLIKATPAAPLLCCRALPGDTRHDVFRTCTVHDKTLCRVFSRRSFPLLDPRGTVLACISGLALESAGASIRGERVCRLRTSAGLPPSVVHLRDPLGRRWHNPRAWWCGRRLPWRFRGTTRTFVWKDAALPPSGVQAVDDSMAEGVAYNDTWRKMWSHAQLGTRDLPPRARLVKERLSGLFDRLEAMNVQTAIQMCPKEHIVDWYPPNLASTGLMGAQADVRAAPKKVEH